MIGFWLQAPNSEVLPKRVEIHRIGEYSYGIESHNRATVISTVNKVEMLTQGLLYPLVGFLVEWSLNGTLMLIGGGVILCALLSRIREEHLVD